MKAAYSLNPRPAGGERVFEHSPVLFLEKRKNVFFSSDIKDFVTSDIKDFDTSDIKDFDTSDIKDSVYGRAEGECTESFMSRAHKTT